MDSSAFLGGQKLNHFRKCCEPLKTGQQATNGHKSRPCYLPAEVLYRQCKTFTFNFWFTSVGDLDEVVRWPVLYEHSGVGLWQAAIRFIFTAVGFGVVIKRILLWQRLVCAQQYTKMTYIDFTQPKNKGWKPKAFETLAGWWGAEQSAYFFKP